MISNSAVTSVRPRRVIRNILSWVAYSQLTRSDGTVARSSTSKQFGAIPPVNLFTNVPSLKRSVHRISTSLRLPKVLYSVSSNTLVAILDTGIVHIPFISGVCRTSQVRKEITVRIYNLVQANSAFSRCQLEARGVRGCLGKFQKQNFIPNARRKTVECSNESGECTGASERRMGNTLAHLPLARTISCLLTRTPPATYAQCTPSLSPDRTPWEP